MGPRGRGEIFVAIAIEQRSAPAAENNVTTRQASQQGDPLDRLAELSTRIRPYSAEAMTIALICVGAATALRFLGSWTNSDFLFATYFPSILAAGLLAGIPAAAGVTIASAFIVRLFFFPSYLRYASHNYGEYIDFLMYLISAALTISFAHYCRVVLNRLHKRNLVNETLAGELQHRSKNVCTVLDVIVRKSLADDPDRATKVSGRIRAMMYANELLTASQPQLLSLKRLLLQAFAPYGDDRVEAFGPEIFIEPEAARHLTLLVHELVTNAAKYGSLSRLSGRIFVDWRADDETIVLNWKERGGPTIDLPEKEGFGSQLAAACVKALSGSIKRDFAPDGFACSIRFKVSAAVLS
jgi:two-component sensor histidine kinase